MHRTRYVWGIVVSLLFLSACEDPGEPGGGDGSDPIAVISVEPNAMRGVAVELDGSASHDADDDDLTFAWTFTSRPQGSSATIANADEEIASFIPDVTGTYAVRLVVSDGDGDDEATATIVVEVQTLGSIPVDSLIGNTAAPASEADYRVADGVTVTFGADVTIEPGVTILLGAGSRIVVAEGGSLSAIGTAVDSIRFLGENDVDGHWSGIEIDSNSPANRLSYVVVANAGASGYTGLYLDGTVRIDHSHFRDSSTFGIYASSSATLPDFMANRFTGSALGPLEIPADLMGSLDAATLYTGNTIDLITVYGASTGSAQTWRDTNAPFFLLPNATITINSAISVDPGFELRAGEGARVFVPAGGSISAIGTAADSIVFRGASETTGYWAGIEIDSNAANTMAYVRIGHGGAFGFGNIWLDGTLTIADSFIHHSSTYGIDYDDQAILTVSGAVFADNTQGDLHEH